MGPGLNSSPAAPEKGLHPYLHKPPSATSCSLCQSPQAKQESPAPHPPLRDPHLPRQGWPAPLCHIHGRLLEMQKQHGSEKETNLLVQNNGVSWWTAIAVPGEVSAAHTSPHRSYTGRSRKLTWCPAPHTQALHPQSQGTSLSPLLQVLAQRGTALPCTQAHTDPLGQGHAEGLTSVGLSSRAGPCSPWAWRASTRDAFSRSRSSTWACTTISPARHTRPTAAPGVSGLGTQQLYLPGHPSAPPSPHMQCGRTLFPA